VDETTLKTGFLVLVLFYILINLFGGRTHNMMNARASMVRRHQLTEKEVPEAIKGLHLRLLEHLEKRVDLSAALTCYRAYYRLSMHEAHRPTYPGWVLKPNSSQEVVWARLKSVVDDRMDEIS